MRLSNVIFVQDWADPETKHPRGASLHLTVESCESYSPPDVVVKARKWHKVLTHDSLKTLLEAESENGGYRVQEAEMDSILDEILLPHPPTSAFRRGFRINPKT